MVIIDTYGSDTFSNLMKDFMEPRTVSGGVTEIIVCDRFIDFFHFFNDLVEFI